MAVLEIAAFELVHGVEDAAFLSADAALQTEFAYQQPGFVRRTTARSAEGSWLVVTVWETEEAADAAADAARKDPVAVTFRTLLDPASERAKRYLTIS